MKVIKVSQYNNQLSRRNKGKGKEERKGKETNAEKWFYLPSSVEEKIKVSTELGGVRGS